MKYGGGANQFRSIAEQERAVRKVNLATFKAKCTTIIDQVHSTCEPVLVTRRGKALAKIVHPDMASDDIFGFMRGRAKIAGNITSPISVERKAINKKKRTS